MVIAVMVGLLAWKGSDRQPADSTRPLEWYAEQRLAPVAGQTLSLTSWNIHHGEGPDGVEDLERIAELLESSDVAAMYEVAGSWNSNQAYELADLTGHAAVFAGTERRWWHDHWGNAVLSRVHASDLMRIPLPGTQGRKFRNAVLMQVPMGPGSVRILCVHLDRVADRERQLRQVVGLFQALEPPCVLMGDLNTRRDDPVLGPLLAQPDVQDVLDARGVESSLDRIDWMLVRGLQVVEAEIRDNGGSDHPCLSAQLRTPPTADQ